ncbi:MAG TPA: hypothetical protein PLN95_00350 [Candidatus Saccharibacteria bacterium]|nr:hypothetical protein [Candidatus Saccharibacteria bacterium]
MESLKLIDRKARYIAAAGALLLATVIPALAMAAQLTERSVQLSSSIKAATGVSYAFEFDATENAGAVVVQFCENTPLIGEFCDAPTGFSAAGATASGGATISGTPTANKVIVTATITATTETFTLGNITNPTNAGQLYARILTYADATAAGVYDVDDDSSTLGSPEDQGSVAVYINEGVSVSGAVLETLSFCVSGAAIAANCGSVTAPTLQLGEDVGGVIALNSEDVYEGTIYTQLSTNAADGAIVRLKSNATGCGGLLRSSDTSACDIGPQGSTGTIAAGDAKFGVKTGAADADADGTIQPFSGGIYDNTNFRLGYAGDNLTGVTSPYGDPLLDTDDAPADNKAMPLTFGASVSNNTPAGNYSANLSLIATGKF